MKFIGLVALARGPELSTGRVPTESEVFRRAIDTAVFFEELGFDGFGIGERHHPPFLATAPTVVLGYIAAVTSRIRLFTGVTLLSVLDPVRVAEDFATIDHLSGGRIELIIGKGAGPDQTELFGLTREQARDALTEKFRLLHRLWTERGVTWSGTLRPDLHDVTTLPRPLQSGPPHGRPRIWHGSSTSTESVDLAAEYGDPVMFSNASAPTEEYAWLAERYAKKWDEFGREPAARHTGAGTPALYTARTSQQALADYRPVYEARLRAQGGIPALPRFPTLEDFAERGPALVGSPAQIIDKVHRDAEHLGHTSLIFSTEPEGLAEARWRESHEIFASEVVPELRRSIPDPPWPSTPSTPATP
ncbi:LLM class flavin-dependent oxidoreductase [Parafrankia sp. EUN1f]|uniref:LLM class flavin-dependent oxidoreductase n=1 Tax=Parafrankia sp. EUN1f TaxID=102897 RepID=UPI0001C45A6D|nr:LLM class flavin-dependent oxidoreductase [Parafrankia sp. EUN1f]EFC82759.1 Luciferase-like monooxygenase [Parafrankia sp. EUN1f]